MTDVSHHLRRLGQGGLLDYANRALAAIDAVHTDGGLPIIGFDEKVMFGIEQARFYHRHNLIEVDPTRAELEFGFIHEIGHAIDFSSGKGKMASIASPELMNWRDAALNSRGYARLLALAANATNDFESELAADMLRMDEMWARSYAQYIVIRSHDLRIFSQLKGRQGRPDAALQAQWEDDDFTNLDVAIDDYLRMLSWKG